jgi:Multisubunit Na+/H+ antiporter, MnhB subunit
MELLMGFVFILIIASAIAVVVLKDLLAAAVALSACGFLIGIMFFLMMAPDLAIVQFVIETLTLFVLVIAIARTHRRSTGDEPAKIRSIMGIIVICIFLLFSSFVVPLMTEFGSPVPGVSQHYINRGIEETGSENLITSILLDYRAYDTLGEIIVLFVSVLAVSLILRKESKGSR